MDDDCWLPGLQRTASRLALTGHAPPVLLDGFDRDRPGEPHAFVGREVEYRWDARQRIAGARLVFDSNLQLHKRMPCTYPHKISMPKSLVKSFRLEDERGVIFRETNNHQRLVRVPLHAETRSLRLVVEETWGNPDARLFAFDPLETWEDKIPRYPDGPTFTEVRARAKPADLEPPEGETTGIKRRLGA
jgi:hypothetical protein